MKTTTLTAATAKTLKYTASCLGLIASSVLAVSSSAQAFDFKTNYQAALPNPDTWKGDILLQSVEIGNTAITDFAVVSGANIVWNDLWTGGDTGAASADRGDLATVGLSQEKLDNNGVVAALGNLYLSSIIDTEDSGKSTIDLSFNKAVDKLFFWERGKNSQLDIQALDAGGNLIGNLFSLGNSSSWQNAGYKLDTLEINGAQDVGSKGVTLADLGVSGPISGLRVITKSSYQGPDWKVVGSAASVPEPATLAGLGLVAGSLAASRRRKVAKVS
ncbi:exosortase-dependent surface protein XDP2 [Kamptonema formosum]|uniref:exosortase-dependent surface protein XDP2 n=1 Tax=Kamptonema formosum TaxID=331992 RepID=UPI000346F9F9|nr:exosortase-dependent surface protein XDP2 [Oscillatoria sp. PCC 10802]